MKNNDGKTQMFLPKIRLQDFTKFKSILKGDMAENYEDWLQRHKARIAEYSSEWCIIEVYVDPDEFRDFCELKSLPIDGMSLLRFAESLGRA